MSQLKVTELCKQYGTNTVVSGLNFTVAAGEMLSLLGPSGCGKTTTLRMIAGLQEPTSGTIALNGKDLTYVAPHKRNVGLVFQNYALFPHLNIFDNVAFGLRRHGVAKAEIGERVTKALESVHLGGYEKRLPAQLSGGQQQRVALARTLVLHPPLVLFDEPLSNLDAKLRQILRVEIRSLQKEYGFTGIFVTHDQEEAMVLSDRIAVMNQGQIVQIGTPQQIYTEPADSFVADFVGESNLLRIVSAGDADGRWRIEVAGGARIAAEGQAGRNEPAYAMVRPEAAEVVSAEAFAAAAAEDAGCNTLTGQVAFIHYTGASYLIGVEVAGMDKCFVARMQSGAQEPGVRAGDRAVVRWPLRATLLL